MLDSNKDNRKNDEEINDKSMNINATNNSNIANDHVTFLHQIPLFSGLTDQQLKTIEEGEEVWFEAGDKILSEGAHDTFYVLLDGKVEVILRDGSKEAVLSSYDSGDHFGELPIILGWSDHKCACMLRRKAIC
jgi:signal-transduction protein with cAMP-binding, CBS, and nucleotidyltransferase domain